MNLEFDAFVVGWLMVLAGAFLCVPLAAAFIFGEPAAPWAAAILLSAGPGVLTIRSFASARRTIRPADGFLVVGGAWLVVSVLGAIPYVAAGILGPADAFFETVSGFTTTGSTVITDVTVIPKAHLLWRAMTQWLGGMGIILFTIAILPLLGIGGMQLFKAEVPGPVADKVQPRLASTARSLWAIYVGLTGLEWLALRLAGIGGFEALCHALTTLATGGFSTRNTSVGAFGNPTVEWIVTLFMLLAGINFVLHFKLITGRWRDVLRDAELRYFLSVAAVATAVVALVIHRPGRGIVETVRTASFNVVSILTTTGYVSVDFERWPELAHLVLLVLMVLGGMSGSTGGGIKSLRALLSFRSLRVTMRRLIHPHAVQPVKFGGAVVDEGVLSGIWAFLTAYALLALLGAAVMAGYGYDLLTAISAALTALGNVGPGLGEVGAYDNFAHLPETGKVVLAFLMLFGRLEVFTLLALFMPGFWKR